MLITFNHLRIRHHHCHIENTPITLDQDTKSLASTHTCRCCIFHLPGVSKTLMRYDFPLVSGKTKDTGTLLILRPL